MELEDKLREKISRISKKEIDKYFQKDTIQKGWLSIDDYLPIMLVGDCMACGTKYKVRYNDGSEGFSMVYDHNIWYYYAKECGITHWFNE